VTGHATRDRAANRGVTGDVSVGVLNVADPSLKTARIHVPVVCNPSRCNPAPKGMYASGVTMVPRWQRSWHVRTGKG